MRQLTSQSRPVPDRRHRFAATLAATLSLAVGACTPAPAAVPGTGVAVVSTPLAPLPCSPTAASPQDEGIAPSVDSLLADMRAQQASADCKRVDGAPAPSAGPIVLAPPPVAAVEPAAPPVAAPPAPPVQVAVQTQAPVDQGIRQPAIAAQNATQVWIAVQQILNRPNTNRETQALYASLCKSGDQSSCLMAQALGQKPP